MENTKDWQLKNKNLSDRGKYLLESGLWSDCKFIVGTAPNTRTFSAHKIFLSMASPVFEVMFHGALAEKEMVIDVPDVQTEAFEAMLKYVYTDDISLASIEQACELCYTAKKYMLPLVISECMKFIWMDVDHLSACRAYEFAALFDEVDLKKKCLDIISQNATIIFKEKSFLEVQKATLKKIVESETLSISSELELTTVLLNWANEECKRKGLDLSNKDNIRNQVVDLLGSIRFLTLKPAEFAASRVISSMLTPDEMYRVLMRISSPNCVVSYPEKFCDKTEARTFVKYITNKVCCCKRTIVQHKLIHNVHGRMENYCTFKTDKDIIMVGLQVPSQIIFEATGLHPGIFQSSFTPKPFTFTPCSQSIYKEDITVHMHDPLGRQMAYGYFDKDVKHGTIIDIKFSDSTIIHKDIKYKLTVVLNQKGTYSMGTYAKHTNNCAGVLFTFYSENTTESLRDCFVQSILFFVSPKVTTDEICRISSMFQLTDKNWGHRK